MADNRYDELNKLLQYEIDGLINTLASHSKSMDPDDLASVIRGARFGIVEAWRDELEAAGV